MSRITPLGAVARGVVAGAAGTFAMDVLLYARYRAGGGDQGFAEWEFSAGLTSWDNAPAPALVGKRVVEGLLQRDVPPEQARLFNNLTHWAFGILAAVPYGIVAGSLRTTRVGYGLPFGTAVWATGYAVLPATGLYKPIGEYDKKVLANDLSAHFVYGLVTAATFRSLANRAT